MQPPSSLARFERVQVISSTHHPALIGARGTIIWSDAQARRRAHESDEQTWLHVVELETGLTKPLWESDLRSLNEIGTIEPHLGRRNEISFDLLDLGIEGCLRRPGTFWECFYIRASDREAPDITSATWTSGIRGHEIVVPTDFVTTQASCARLLSALLEMPDAHIIRGPDSMYLK